MATSELTERAGRLRIIDDPADALPTAEELRWRAVLVTARVAGGDGTNELNRRLVPWLNVWTEHPSYRHGYWRCVVDHDTDSHEYGGNDRGHLAYHNDMTRYLRPPEFTLIRCVAPDSGGGGANLLLHLDDVVRELRHRASTAILAMLAQPRPLMMEDRHRNVPNLPSGVLHHAPLVVADDPGAPGRIFDRGAADKGTHLGLSKKDDALLDDFLRICHGLNETAICLRLEAGELLAFSNWRFLHARTPCHAAGRVTEIAMGNERASENRT